MTAENPHTPSRSEIENALLGRTKKAPLTRKKRPAHDDFQFDVSPRRQQVIGGDLSGVSNRRKKSLLTRYADISIINWVAGFIVLLILAAFFWPHNSEPIKEVVERQNSNKQVSIYSEERVDEQHQVKQTGKLSFSRNTDAERADVYRESDANDIKVRALLESAKLHISKGEYTLPAKSNAANAYNAILKLSPGNIDAKQGLEFIANRFVTAGYTALEKSNLTQANTALKKLKSLNPESYQTAELSDAIAVWKTEEKVATLFKNADAAFAKQNLILPTRNNALFYYQQVLKYDEGSQEALNGIKKIADSYVDKANSAFVSGEYSAANGYLATVGVIDPEHEGIPLLEAMFSNIEPIPTNIDTPPQDDENQVKESSEQNTNLKPVQNTRISENRTPKNEANEQALFDKQYLNRGLDAYYKGDYEAAASLLQPLADKGVSRAQFRIGYMYYLGRGFKKDRKEADRVIRAALPAIRKFANEGRTWAQSDLGSLYEDGLVLPRDYGEAVYWYRSAAEKGYPGAQTNLGIMYARGRGVTSSRRTAVEWFQRAAKQGDVVAQRNLKAMGL